jgi:hypothetical protein
LKRRWANVERDQSDLVRELTDKSLNRVIAYVNTRDCAGTGNAERAMTTNENTNTMNCQEALNLIALYLDDDVSERERSALQKHLETCRHCFDRVEFEKLLDRASRL